MLYYDTVRMNVHTQLHDNSSSQSLHVTMVLSI